MYTTRETRRESYSKILPSAPPRRQLILGILRGREMTALEIAEALHIRGHTPFVERNFAAPRLTELKKAGCVRVVGKRYCQQTGRNVAVWARVSHLPAKASVPP
ncbi:DNA gyrase [Oscillospiraceae bacterium OttesenSCG-928-F05]|nr:DNA gyrase [Oscillospiraceae bacterium OttesenSCG-928-F05]